MTTREQAAALRQYEAGGTVAESDLPALEAGARALDLLAMAEGAETVAFDVQTYGNLTGARRCEAFTEEMPSMRGATEAAARRALAARLLATALRLLEGE
jgi:hypothetical protein